jgi:hypothetical protein
MQRHVFHTLTLLATLSLALGCLEATKMERSGGGGDSGGTYDAGHDAVPDSNTDSGWTDGGWEDGGGEDYIPPPPDGDDMICPPVMCDSSGDPCWDVSFNPNTCDCDYEQKPEGAQCEDGDPCTDMDTCFDGMCISGMPIPGCGQGCGGVQCEQDPVANCEQMVMDPQTCTCFPEPRPDGTPCDDYDPCSVGDQCFDGFCQPGFPDPTCGGGCEDGSPPCVTDEDCGPGASCFDENADGILCCVAMP